jgi:hypothetical protein
MSVELGGSGGCPAPLLGRPAPGGVSIHPALRFLGMKRHLPRLHFCYASRKSFRR